MKRIISKVLLGLIIVTGCSSVPKYEVSQDLDRSKLAKLHIYRTNAAYHSLNPEKPYFYINGKEIGKLGTGEAKSIDVQPGNHTITVKEPIMFMPGYENGRVEIEVRENEEYYVRYSKDFSGVVVTGGTSTTTTGKTTIRLVDKEYFIARK